MEIYLLGVIPYVISELPVFWSSLLKAFRAAALLCSILMSVFILDGCQRPSIDGDFISTRGAVTVTLKDGKFSSGNGALTGTYVLSADHDIRLTGATGAVYEGFMPDRDSIIINRENGQDTPGFSWSRVGTSAANGTLANYGVINLGVAPPADAFKPDPSVPLSAYTAIVNQLDAGMVLIPWSGKAATDDDLVRQFTTAFNSSDTFKRQDIAQQELPTLHGRMDETVKQRYYSININNNTDRDPFVFSQMFVNAYNLSTRSFRLSSLGNDCWKPHELNMRRMPYGFWIEQSDKSCQVSVPDEATARQIEDLRSRSMLNVGGTIGVCITHTGPNNGRVFVALTYAHIVLSTSRGPAFKFETDL